jgi:hypothetical protein
MRQAGLGQRDVLGKAALCGVVLPADPIAGAQARHPHAAGKYFARTFHTRDEGRRGLDRIGAGNRQQIGKI